MKLYQYSLEELQALSNQVKEVVASSLVREGFLTEEKREEYLENYIVMVTERGFIGKAIDRMLGLDKKEKKGVQVIHIVKRV